MNALPSFFKPSIDALVATPDGKHIISSGSNQIVVWDVETCTPIYTFTDVTDARYPDHMDHLVITPDGRYLFAAGRGSWQIYCWDLETRSRVLCKGQGASGVYGIAVTPDGRKLVSGHDTLVLEQGQKKYYHTLRVWDIKEFVSTGSSGGFSAIGQKAEVVHEDLPIVTKYESIENRLEKPDDLCLSPDGRWLAIGCVGGEPIHIWNFQTKQLHCVLPEYYDGPLAFTEDSKFLIAAQVAFDGMGVFSVETAQKEFEFMSGASPDDGWYQIGNDASKISLSSDGRFMAVASPQNYVRLWSWDRPEELETTFTVDGGMRCCSFVPNTYLLVTGDDTGEVHFLDLEGT